MAKKKYPTFKYKAKALKLPKSRFKVPKMPKIPKSRKIRV